MVNDRKIGVVIPAAGQGRRMNGQQKLFLDILGKPVITYTLRMFDQSPIIDFITVVTSAEYIDKIRELVKNENFEKITRIVEGGNQRQDSVWNGLQEIANDSPDIIVVHDGARPFVDNDIISRAVESADLSGAAIAAVPAKDTIKLADSNNIVTNTLERDHTWLIQTPQASWFDLMFDAFQKAMKENYYSTDESSLLERYGVKVKIVQGSYENIKITTLEDIDIAQSIAKRRFLI